MPEKLLRVHRNDLETMRKYLKTVISGDRTLRSGVYNPWVNSKLYIPPKPKCVVEHRKAVEYLGREMPNLPRATYDIYLEAQGDWYSLEVGISGLDVKRIRTEKLERVINRIYGAVEKTQWKPHIISLTESHENHTQEDVAEVVANLIHNNGDLELFDRIPFFLAH